MQSSYTVSCAFFSWRFVTSILSYKYLERDLEVWAELCLLATDRSLVYCLNSREELRFSFKLNVWILSRDSLSDFSLLTLELLLDLPIELSDKFCLLRLIDG